VARIKLMLFLLCAVAAAPLLAQQYDVLIRNGRVIDGSGNPLGYALVVAVDAENVGLEGPGTVDGQSPQLKARQKKLQDKAAKKTKKKATPDQAAPAATTPATSTPAAGAPAATTTPAPQS